MNGSSGRQRVAASTLSEYPTAIPPYSLIMRYTDIVEEFMGKMKECRDENKLLTSLRDSLLPKLMSGEIEIPIESEEEVHVQV